MSTFLPTPTIDPAYGTPPENPSLDGVLSVFRDLIAGSVQGGPRQPKPDRVPVVLNNEQRQRLARQLQRHYQEGADLKGDLEQYRTDRYRRYLADPSLRDGLQPWPNAPRLFLPLVRSTVESLKTNLSAELFESLDKIAITGIGKEDLQGAKRAEIFFRWWLEEVVRIRQLNSDLMLDVLIDSLGILKVYPFKNIYPPLSEDAVYFETECRMEVVDQADLILPNDATGLQFPECRFIGHRLRVHPDMLMDMRERGFKIPDLKELTQENAVSIDDERWTEDEKKWLEFERSGIDPQPRYPDPKVEVVEFYVLFAPQPEEPRQFFIVHWMPRVRGMQHAEDTCGMIMRIARLEDAIPQAGFSKPTWPFFDFKLWGQPRQLRGMDVPTRLESMQDILNRQAEQMLQDGDVNIVPFYFYNAALTGELPDLTEVKPGAGIPIDTAGQVFFPPRQSQNRHYAEQMTFAQLWAERDSNITAFTQGRATEQPHAPRTLGGQQLLMDAANKSFNEQTALLADQWQPALRMAFAVWQSRLPDSIEIPMPDLAGIEERLLDGSEAPLVMQAVRHDDLSGLFDVRIKVDPEAFLKQQRQLQLATVLDPILAPIWPLGRRELWKQLWELMKLEDFDRLWPEHVAVTQTLITIMQAQLQMAVLDMQLGGAAHQAAAAALEQILMSLQEAQGVDGASDAGGSASATQPLGAGTTRSGGGPNINNMLPQAPQIPPATQIREPANTAGL